jgi:hypothetical protein
MRGCVLSSVFLFKDQAHEVMTHEDGTPYTFEEFLEELKQIKPRKFEPYAYYNKVGDLLELYWEEADSVVEWQGGGIEVCLGFGDKAVREKVVGAKFWGLKKMLLKAYADCDKPEKMIVVGWFVTALYTSAQIGQ